MNMFKNCRSLIFIMTFTVALSLVFAIGIQAQYWTIMPPYNVLWPLWSPGLSPIDPVTGLTTPLVSSLTRNTMLPVQPGLVWDPCQPNPFLLYNTPPLFGSGLLYYYDVYGFNPWPPSYMLDPLTGVPAPITLPLSYWLLGPIAFDGINAYHYVLGNLVYSNTYGVPITSLLTAQQFWGLPDLTVGIY